MYPYSDSVVVDVQFLSGKNKENIIKELAILPVNCPNSLYFLFKAPYPFFKLGKRNQFQNLYNCRHINGLDWYSGNVDYSTIKEVLSAYQNCTIIVKGLEKKAALEKYLPYGTNIVNLQDESRLEDLQDFVHNCPYHESTYNRCALNNAYKIRRILEQKNLLN